MTQLKVFTERAPDGCIICRHTLSIFEKQSVGGRYNVVLHH